MGSGVNKVGIMGASGYTGAELLRLCAMHPKFDVVWAGGESHAGDQIADLYPSLAAAYPERIYETYMPQNLDGLDIVFLALPHGISQHHVPEIYNRVGHIVDLSSDFRLHEQDLYPQWYGAVHDCPELLDKFVYGLPELFRSEIIGAELIANTGCNAAAAIFALAPILEAGLVDGDSLVASIITGVSGAGRPAKSQTTFCAVNEDVRPYALLNHRHTPEIEQALAERTGKPVSVLFTPHLAPMNRGIIATCYGRSANRLASSSEAIEALHEFYRDEPFIVISDHPPSTKSTLGANTVHLTARVDPRTGLVISIATLDNLMKGAAGMAVQNANLALGLPETTGLPVIGLYP